jgi:hypothetical protein
MTAVFITYGRDDRAASASLADELRGRGMTVVLGDNATGVDAAAQVDRDEFCGGASSGVDKDVDAMPDDATDWSASDMDLASAIDALDRSAAELLAVAQHATRMRMTVAI